MTDNDDTVARDPQSREDVLLAMLEAGALPGIGLGSPSDVADLGSQGLVIARVSRNCFEGGPEDVAICALAFRERLLDLPEPGRGRTILSFDGWAGDPRPLFEVPEIVVFCRALLLGAGFLSVRSGEECARLARPILGVLFDERAAWDGDADPLLPPTYPELLDASGSLWLVGHAFASDVFARHPQSPTGYARDIAMNLTIDSNLRTLG